MTPAKLHKIQARLLKWYRSSARDLPWRRTKDPYKIWVSEIMLQQTQVDTVIPYYNKFIRQFPTVKKLANTPLSKVLRFWAGLGYYRRARMLHQSARIILKDQRGRMPVHFEDWLKLPGIGRYTASAISSIAYNQTVPVLDGNVIRILSRIFAVKDDINIPATQKKLWLLAGTFLDKQNAGDFNQAMMELGAMVCSPENPDCEKCPAASFCTAHQKKQETLFPVNGKKEKLIPRKMAALILRKKAAVLIEQRAIKDRWGGLWMFPFWDHPRAMAEKTGAPSKMMRPFMTLRHGYTKYRMELDVYEKEFEDSKDSLGGFFSSNSFVALPPSRTKWVAIENLKKFAFPSPHQKIVDRLVSL